MSDSTPSHPDGHVGGEREARDAWLPLVPDAVDLVVETESMISVFAAQRYRRVEAMRREALTDAARHGYALTEVIERSVRLELAAALAMTEAAAGRLIAEAYALVNRYPLALDSLAGARTTHRHCALLAEALDAVEPEFHDRLLGAAVALAESEPVGTFRRKLRALIETVRSVTVAQRHEAALPQRRVVLEPAADGMAWLHALIPAVEAHAIHGRLTGQAKVLALRDGETRALDQLRADLLGDILIDGVPESLPPEARGIRAAVVVTVPALTLLGAEGCANGLATVEGVGPIPIAKARELCGAAEGWMRVLTHPETGMVLSVGRKRYRPPPELRRLARWRAETCMAPGCGVPASRCEIDHNVAWHQGGTTSLGNLTPFCKGHHIVKHHGRWRVEQIDGGGGAILWTSPTGRRYRVEPERRLPVFVPVAGAPPPPF
ncbi:HNH endonuclease signature motif containing protein [Microbacterium deminutum]|uniref:HNH endonuclease signature motif containing protein n=1 Tax=Microbacterium deminutum TaxID=344164 RepID=A0ABN2R7C5_9MICO